MKHPLCPKCSKENFGKSRRLSNEDFLERVHSYHPNIQILSDYVLSSERVNCKCSIDGYEWSPVAESLLRGFGCPKCGQTKLANLFRMSQDEFDRRMKLLQPNLEYYDEYKGYFNHLKCICKVCGSELNPAISSLFSGYQCPVCNNRNFKGAIVGKSDLETTHPHLVRFFVNKNDCRKYSHGSHASVLLQCPKCGMYQNNIISVITKYGFNCHYCSDNVSKPNKIIRALLQILPVQNYTYEYSPDWAGRYRYDAYFEYDNIPYLVEMDGGFHYSSGIKGFYKKEDLENTQFRDKEKDNLAKEHNIELIRIDCSKASIKSIKNNIINSKIGKLFDLKNINFEELLYQGNFILVEPIGTIYDIDTNTEEGD